MNLYVGNLAAAVRQADLQHLFEGVGHILYARMAGEAAAQDKGYAYVYVPNDDTARSTVRSLHGTVLKGEPLTVQPLTERLGVIGGTRR